VARRPAVVDDDWVQLRGLIAGCLMEGREPLWFQPRLPYSPGLPYVPLHNWVFPLDGSLRRICLPVP
jgi:hypothetical protein